MAADSPALMMTNIGDTRTASCSHVITTKMPPQQMLQQVMSGSSSGREHGKQAAAAQQWMSTGGQATSASAAKAQLASGKQPIKPAITMLGSSVDLASILM